MLLALRALPVRIPPQPVFVLGNQKSGTTAIAALLAERTGRSVTLDLAREMREPTFQFVRSGNKSFRAFLGRNKVQLRSDIIKEPNLVVLFDHLLQTFPDSPFVLVVRDPRDNLRSILNRLDFPGHLEQLDRPYEGLHAEAWNLYLDGRWLGLGGETYIDTLAERWNLAADVYLDHTDRVLLVRYEDFLRDKSGEITRLADRLGWPAVHDISSRVDVQFQPRGNRDVSWDAFFGARNLMRIEQRCLARMTQFGYRPTSAGQSSLE